MLIYYMAVAYRNNGKRPDQLFKNRIGAKAQASNPNWGEGSSGQAFQSLMWRSYMAKQLSMFGLIPLFSTAPQICFLLIRANKYMCVC